jgi:AhpD family alkylhydroperoxidase
VSHLTIRATLRDETASSERGEPMQARLNAEKIAPDAMKVMKGLEEHVRNSGLEPTLLELIRTRASQINGCAYCLNLHTHDARVRGETEARLYLLNAWRESPLYNDRERAALAWTEAVTLIAQTHAPDETYNEARRHFSETELVNLTLAVATINAWNRLAISFRVAPQV